MKKYVATILISFILAVLSADDKAFINKRIIPIVYTIEKLPVYWRKKVLNMRFFPKIILK
jgi:hypothetical protein